MKKIILSALMFSSITSVFAQKDSITVVNYSWKNVKLEKGVVWKQGHFNDLFDSQQEVNIIEVNLKKKKIGFAADSVKLKKTSAFAKEVKALAAINGGFFDMKNGGSVDFIKIDDKVVNASKGASARANGALIIDGKKVIIDDYRAGNDDAILASNVMVSGPVLVKEGKSVELSNNAFNSNRHPRTAVGITSKKRMYLLVVDGRNASAQGMSLPELSKLMRWMGANDAMNLDGGGSSALYIKGEGIVSYPSDNKLFDNEGERSVANIVYVK